MERNENEREEELIFEEDEDDEEVPEEGTVDLTYLQRIRCHP